MSDDSPNISAPILAGLDSTGNDVQGSASGTPSTGGPQASDPGPAPDVSSQSAPALPNGTPTTLPSPAQPSAQPSFMRTLLLGALNGLAGSNGSTTFAGGLGGGVKGVQDAAQRQVDNANRAQLLQFESLKAAASVAQAHNEARAADNQNEKDKLIITRMHDDAQEWAEEHGVTPKVTLSAEQPSDFHAQASGALATLAASNGGKIPQITTTNDPATANSPAHNVNVYSVNANDVQANEGNTLKIINQARSVSMPGAPPLEQSDLQQAGAAKTPGNWRQGAAELANDAMGQLMKAPAVSVKNYANGEGQSENAAIGSTLQQQLSNFIKSNSADPAVTKLLQNKVDMFNALSQDANQRYAATKSATVLGTAAADATAAGMKTAKEQDTPTGRANLAKTIQEKISSQNTNADKGLQLMWANGTNPATGEKLNLNNAPDEMLVDQKTGLPIPTKMLSTLKPTQTESNRADFAKSVLHSLDNLDTLEKAGKLPNGPINGVTAASLSKLGLSTKDQQQALNDISFVQSAATGAHVGGRFSLPVMEKMNNMIGLNMNSAQFAGAKDSIRDVMNQYATQGGRMTVAEYKADQAARSQAPPPGADNQVFVQGKLVGHTVGGKFVALGAQ